MSGRTLHWREGKLITNRKTDRRQSPPHQPPPKLILSFTLPDLTRELIEIVGYDRQYLLDQMIATLRRVAMQGLPRPVDIHIRREDELPRKWHSKSRPFQILWNGREATFIHGGVMRPLTQQST